MFWCYSEFAVLKATTAVFFSPQKPEKQLQGKSNRLSPCWTLTTIIILLIVFCHIEHYLPETRRKKKKEMRGGNNLRKNSSSIRETEERQVTNTATFLNSKQSIRSNKSNCENGRNRLIFSHFSMWWATAFSQKAFPALQNHKHL